MADIYLRSTDGSDADDGSSWANAKATLAAALTAAGAGGRVFVSHVHAETQASAMTLASPGTSSSPTQILCVNDAGSVPPVSADLRTGATVSTTGASAINFSGVAYCRGVSFRSSSGAASTGFTFNSASLEWIFELCLLVMSATGTGTIGIFAANLIRWINTTLTFGATGQRIEFRNATVEWLNTASAISGTIPTTLIIPSTTGGGRFTIRNVDLSGIGSGKNLVSVATAIRTFVDIIDCKLGASVSLTTGTIVSGPVVRLINSDSADTNYRYQKSNYQGTITHEATIVRSRGAFDGTTPLSYKMVSTANSKYQNPLESDWITFWNDAIGSALTVSIPIVTDNVTLKDNEAWIEVEYFGTSGFPLALGASDKAADILNTGTNQATDADSSWTTTGLTTPVKQVLSTSVTPQERGLLRARVCLAKASTTLYLDPTIVAGRARTYMGESGYINEGRHASVGVRLGL